MLTTHLPSRWPLLFHLCLTLATLTAHADAPSGLVVPLDEGKLAHMETTLDHFAAQFKTDPALKKDIKSFGGDKNLAGDTLPAVSASIAKLHPKFAAAAAAEKWAPGDLYLTYLVFVGISVSERTSGATSKDAEDRGVRRAMEFYEQHKDRVDTMVTRFSKAMGY